MYNQIGEWWDSLDGRSDLIPGLRPDFDQALYCSSFARSAIKRDPGLLQFLQPILVDGYDEEGLHNIFASQLPLKINQATLDSRMREIRLRQMIAIALRDLAGKDDLDQTMRWLSKLADLSVYYAVWWHYEKMVARHGKPVGEAGNPVQLIVLAMGKLGANELNYSSDIDLILAYEGDGETAGRYPLMYHEFFLRLSRAVYKTLNEVTIDGFVFRVDLRLRPYGNSGPLVMSVSAMEEYYQTQGREWERYAMIKARPIGPDIMAGERLLQRLKPFVYRRYLDFGVIESLRALKVMIDRETLLKGRENDLKLGPGGIREIEFIAQVFQLMRGGKDTMLQCRETLGILKLLAERRYLDRIEADGLIKAYIFLRRSENHIQEIYDQQVHALPTTKEDQQRLSLSMGFDSRASYMEQLTRYRQHVQHCFDGIFAEDKAATSVDEFSIVWNSDIETCSAELDRQGFIDGTQHAKRLVSLRQKGVYLRLSQQGQQRMDKLMPALVALAAAQSDADRTLCRIIAVITAIAPRESYLALLVEEKAACEQLVRLCAASQWITDALTRHPALLDELIDPRRLYAPPDRGGLNEELSRLLADIDEDDMEAQMERFRQFKQAQQLRIAAADIMETMPLMIVSDHLTWLADALVTVVLEMSWQYLLARHGSPLYEMNDQQYQAGFAVIGYGKVGGFELGYGSDLDLVFVHDSKGTQQFTHGDLSIDNHQFFTRLAQRFVHYMATLTPAGILYEVDTRLRPDGQSGVLVTSLESFRRYQQEKAWTWEHQALIRARPLAGTPGLCAQFSDLRREVLVRQQDKAQLRQDVLAMRMKMREQLDNSSHGQFDIKQGAGGIVDIEFMVQCAVLEKASEYPELLAWTDVVRLLESLSERTGWPSGKLAESLKHAYRFYRSVLHRQVLQGESQCIDPADFADTIEVVKMAWQQVFKGKRYEF